MSLDATRLGTDLDIPIDPGEAIPITASGDLALLVGRPALDRNVVRRFATEPGAMLYRSTYGVGVVGRLGRGNSPIERGRIASLGRVNLLQDPRLKDATVTIAASTSDEYTATVGVTATLQDDSKSSLSVSM